MQTLIVGVDGSDASTRAVDFTAEHVTAGRERETPDETTVLLVHVIPWSRYSFQTATDNAVRHTEREREIEAATVQVMQPMSHRLDSAGVPHTTMIRHGKPSHVLVDLAHTEGADQIIVGRLGDSGFKDAVFGSVASRLVQHAPCPVTVVP